MPSLRDRLAGDLIRYLWNGALSSPRSLFLHSEMI